MGSFRIKGGKKLSGEIQPQGAKNEALQIISAVLLTDQDVEINNVPDIRDVNRLIDLLKGLGVRVEKLEDNKFVFNAANIKIENIYSKDYYKNASSIRGSVMLLGPMIARFGKGFLPQPGGDKIGRRRLDTHFTGLEKLGAQFEYNESQQSYYIKAEELKGAHMLLEEASVTGTANILMAAVLAEGETTIFNAACEPYLVQLSKMLNRMGANINGIGSNLLKVRGVKKLNGTTHTMLADMIEVGSFIGMAAVTKSEISIKGVKLADLGLIPDVFRRLGVKLEQRGEDIFIPQ